MLLSFKSNQVDKKMAEMFRLIRNWVAWFKLAIIIHCTWIKTTIILKRFACMRQKYKRQVERSWNMLSACSGPMMTQEPRNGASYMNIPNSISWVVIKMIRREMKMMRMMRSLRTRLFRGWSKFGCGRRPEKWPSLVNQPRKAQPRCHRLHHQLHQNKQYWCKYHSHP